MKTLKIQEEMYAVIAIYLHNYLYLSCYRFIAFFVSTYNNKDYAVLYGTKNSQ